MRVSLLVVALIAVFGLTASPRAQAAPTGAQAGLAGAWALAFDTPQGAMDATATFKVDGDKITGAIESMAGSAPLTGTAKGSSFTANFEVQSPQGPIAIAMAGSYEGDDIKGTFDFGQGTAPFTGKRKTQ